MMSIEAPTLDGRRSLRGQHSLDGIDMRLRRPSCFETWLLLKILEGDLRDVAKPRESGPACGLVGKIDRNEGHAVGADRMPPRGRVVL